MNTLPATRPPEEPADSQGKQPANQQGTIAATPAEQLAEQQADQLELITNQDGQITKVAQLIPVFVASYEQHKHTMPVDRWLVQQFKQYPEVWEGEAEIEQTAQDVVQTVTDINASKASLYAHTDAGKSQASWVAQKIEQGAGAAGAVQVGEYAAQIDAVLDQANTDMMKTVFTKNGDISQAMNLDGFLAEQHHVDSFNIDAAAKGSKLRAKVLTPENGTYGKNSVDIGIYDENDKLVRRYQSKYGKDAEATKDLWDKGDYRGQRKLVPADQVDQVEGATDKLDCEGVESKPLTKEEAKQLQEKAQVKREIKEYKWNEVNRIEIAKQLGKQAVIGACVVAAFQGTRVFGRRIWNRLRGKQNQPLSEDLRDFFHSTLKSTVHVGVQVAVSGAVVVSARNGWLGKALKKSPAGHLAALAVVAVENAKILYKLAKGEITGLQAIDAMGKVTVSTVCSLQGAAWGFAAGAALGAVLGPPGAIVGGVIGAVAAGLIGGVAGDLLYTGGKMIAKAAVGVIKGVATAAGEIASGFLNAGKSAVRSAVNVISSFGSWCRSFF